MVHAHLRSVAALALLAVAAACAGQSPTAVRDAGTATPRRDSGVTFGSGNVVGGTTTTSTGGGVTFGSGNRMDEENTMAADSGSAATGGVTFGSGN